jgi:hypothetical protein
MVFIVQILNAAVFKQVTARDPPPSSIDVETYAKHVYPVFETVKEESGVFGTFDDIKSIGQIDG